MKQFIDCMKSSSQLINVTHIWRQHKTCSQHIEVQAQCNLNTQYIIDACPLSHVRLHFQTRRLEGHSAVFLFAQPHYKPRGGRKTKNCRRFKCQSCCEKFRSNLSWWSANRWWGQKHSDSFTIAPIVLVFILQCLYEEDLRDGKSSGSRSGFIL